MAKEMHLPAWKLRFLTALLVLGMASGQEADGEQSHSTSVAGMVRLLQLEDKLIENLSNYAIELEGKLNIMRSFVEQMRAESNKAMSHTEHYVSNPLNAFSLIRRMHEDWTHLQLYMEQPVGKRQMDYVNLKRHQLPSSTDLEEAAAAIHRIQATYDLQVSDMAAGLLNGKQYNASLNELDTYALGKYHYDQQSFVDASQWINQAINRLNGPHKLTLPLGLNRAEVQHVYAEALIKMNRYADALKVLQIATTIDKNNLKLLQRKMEVETLIRTSPNISPKPYKKKPVSNYERGCRGQFPTQSKLHCVYNSTNSPFLRLAPLKTELLALDPYMVLYHDVITPSEIRELQHLAVPTLKRATVFNQQMGRNTVVKTRTSKVTWLTDSLNPLTVRLNRRISDMTGFDLYGSEMLQVMNYGLGGHYDLHFDYFNATIAKDLTKLNGDRIATVLFYLSDVEQGGATVFPNIKQAIFPKKGTAVMWYNLRHNNNGDPQTMHAACPVIVGSKWVCNKWIREHQQLFRRPCLSSP
ncbi:prolyl 4-hydroxylase subunit alpha-2 [Drosophila montana]|uniref:prolyl 4-hydroxylase subunit alpha-2 n=1 Tax=Drosophila montana TaxID=40370 RepID=UPI00313B242D